MASSPSSDNPREKKYDVFFSFRGGDVRDNFLSHVVAAFRRKQIYVFIDDKLERGNEITPTLLKIIEQSRISIVIFSKNYPNSPWCLDELEKILDCKENRKQIVIPVFYQVDPSDIQELRGNYAITNHTQQVPVSKVENWKRALVEISQLSGFDSENSMFKQEANLCDEMANDVVKKLSDLFSINLQKDKLCGIDSRIKDVELLIELEANGVRMVGIWGMGGIGKTTLADKVFNKIKNNFDGHSFVQNVREKLSKKLEIKDLRDDIIREILGDKDINIGSPHTIDDSIRRRLRDRKVLIVLDDLDNCRELKSLLEGCGLYSPGMFGSGSRIIVTSRNKQVLENVNMEKHIYEAEKLNDDEALQLFSWHAFHQCYPQEEYKELSKKVVHYCNGLPLALVVLGSELKGKRTGYWEAALAEFNCIPPTDIQKIMRISFDGLGQNEKNIFLDIACFFKGECTRNVERILECFGFHARNGIDSLHDKSLITNYQGIIQMHDMVQHMGQEIVVEQSGQMHKNQSRLWTYKDISCVLKNDGGSENVEGICLDVKECDDCIKISSTAFIHMLKLRFLRVIYCKSNCCYKSFDKILLPEGFEFLPNSLKYLEWEYYPSRSLPSNFNLENLVELHMPYSQLEQLIWNKPLRNLKCISLNNSEKLIRILHLEKASNLEVINLRDCTNLADIGSSMRNLNKLTKLCLDGCISLYQLPEISDSVKELNLSRSGIRQLPLTNRHLQSFWSLHSNPCPNFSSYPNTFCNLKSLGISFCKNLNKLPEHLENLQYLECLDASSTCLEELPSSICNLKSLRNLKISDCKNLNNLPEHLGNLQSLEYLNARRTGLDKLPSSICNLKSLRDLEISDCKNLNNLPEHLGNLQYLEKLDVCGTSIEELPSSICNLISLKTLIISCCKSLNKLPEHLGNLRFLECLIAFSAGLEELPSSICILKSLKVLDISNCKKINKVPEHFGNLQSLEILRASGTGLEELPSSIQHLCKLEFLCLRNCEKLEFLPCLPRNLESLSATNCMSLKSVSATFKFPSVCLDLINCGKLNDVTSLIAQEIPWEIQYVPANELSHCPRLCFVGSEVPQWMKYRNDNGCSLCLELDAHGSFIHLIFCVAVAAHPCRDFNPACLDLYASLTDECGVGKDFCFKFNYLNDLGAVKFDFEHVFLWYARHEKVGDLILDTYSFDIHASFSVRYRSATGINADLKIIKCGVHQVIEN